MADKKIHSGHRERLRQRLLETAGRGFCDHELLELLLFYALPRVNTNETAHYLIERFGSLSGVITASPDDLAAMKGISANTAQFLRLVDKLCAMYTSESGSRVRFKDIGELRSYAAAYFEKSDSDICLLLNISPHYQLLNTVAYPTGQLASGEISQRELTETALRNKFRLIVMAVNHPGGIAVPTARDYKIAREFDEALAPLDSVLHDFIVCAGSSTFSMRETGAYSFRG